MSKSSESWLDHAGNLCKRRPNGTISVTTVNCEPSMTVQSEKDSCDFNKIYSKYMKTGLMTNMRTEPPRYGDFSSAVDYHDSLLRAQQAQEAFMSLSADVRRRFSNDPGQLIDFLANEDNRSEAIELGLLDSPQASKVPQGDVDSASKEAE